MSLDHEHRHDAPYMGVGYPPTGAEHGNKVNIPQQRGQERQQPQESFLQKVRRRGKQLIALLSVAGVTAGITTAINHAGPQEIAGAPTAVEGPAKPGENQPQAPSAPETPVPSENNESPPSIVEAIDALENRFENVAPKVVPLGVGEVPSYDEMQSRIDGSRLHIDEATLQKIIDLQMYNFNAACVRLNAEVASEKDDELGKSTVDLSLNTGANAFDTYLEWKTRVLDAARANPDIPKLEGGLLPPGVVQYSFDYNGGEVTASSPHPNTDVFRVPGQLIGMYYAAIPGDPRADKDGIVAFNLGGKLPDGSTAPLVLNEEGSALTLAIFIPGRELSDAIYMDPGETALTPA